MINLHSIAYPVASLGPGERIVIWVSGCRRDCRGCISPEMQDPTSGRPIPVPTLLERLLRIDAAIDGVTISGGEPMDQQEALSRLLRGLRKSRSHWNVMLYTGYSLSEVTEMCGVRAGLLALIDILVDGPFEVEIASRHPLTGSGNQKIHYLSKRGLELKPLIDHPAAGGLELGLGADGFQMLIGVPENEGLNKRGI